MAVLNRLGAVVQSQMHVLIDVFNAATVDRQLTACTILACGGRNVFYLISKVI